MRRSLADPSFTAPPTTPTLALTEPRFRSKAADRSPANQTSVPPNVSPRPQDSARRLHVSPPPNRPGLSLAGEGLAITEGCAPIGQSDPVWFELGFEEGMGSETTLVNGKIVVRSRRGAMVLFSHLC